MTVGTEVIFTANQVAIIWCALVMEFAVVTAWQTVGRQLRVVNRGRVLRANIFLFTGILMALVTAVVPNGELLLKLLFFVCASGMAGIAGSIAHEAERCDGICPFGSIRDTSENARSSVAMGVRQPIVNR